MVQHSEARHVIVRLSYLGSATKVTIQDDGKGISTSEMSDEVHLQGQGLANMRARADMLGAELVLEDGPGHGLSLVLTVPCSDKGGADLGFEEIWA